MAATVKIKKDGAFWIINESDFDPKKDELFVEEVENETENFSTIKELSQMAGPELIAYGEKFDINGLKGKSKSEMIDRLQSENAVLLEAE